MVSPLSDADFMSFFMHRNRAKKPAPVSSTVTPGYIVRDVAPSCRTLEDAPS